MDFTYRQPIITNTEFQYRQAAALIAMQQKLQASMFPTQLQQQNLLLANIIKQKQAMEISNAQMNLKRMISLGNYVQTQRTMYPNGVKVEETVPQPMLPVFQSQQIQKARQTFSKSDIRPMVLFLLNNIGIAEEKYLAEARIHYSCDPLLSSLFDCLVTRYNTSLKTKEEMIKYTLRKALRSLRLKVAKGKESDPKEGMKILIQRYFGSTLKDKQGSEDLSEDQLIEKFLPFKKESRIKTMNTSFVAELFESSEFTKDYNEFLKTFKSIIVADNNRKIEKFIRFLEECYTNQSIEKLKTFKRIPWSNFWINNTLNQARELPSLGRMNTNQRLPKEETETPIQYEPKLEKKVKVEFVENEIESNSTLTPEGSVSKKSSTN